MREPVKCKRCGKEFRPRAVTNTFCSEECQKTYNRLIRSETEKKDKKKRVPRKKRENNLTEDVMAAEEHGMSYGTYMAYKERGWLEGGE